MLQTNQKYHQTFSQGLQVNLKYTLEESDQ
jgi:hypothetical protein